MTDPRDSASPVDASFDLADDAATAVDAAAVPEAGAAPSGGADVAAEVARYKDAWMRSAADFENFRRRSRKEVDDARRSGREDLLKELLPVFDNLERGVQSAKQANEVKAVIDGLSMILKQFESTLARANILRVPGVGTPFDPNLHEAIQQLETSDHPAGTVVAEVQPGYKSGDKLVRAAMVVVAKPRGGGASPNN